MNELKPCPFCRSKDLYIVTAEGTGFYPFDYTVGIFCNGCKQTVTFEENELEGDNDITRARAIEAWNRRAENDN